MVSQSDYLSFQVVISGWIDAAACAERCSAFARGLGFSERASWEVGIASSELAVNIHHHAGRGSLTVRAVDTPAPGLELIAQDDGPGIGDLESAMSDGHSRGRRVEVGGPRDERGGLGTGLGAVSRMMDEVDIRSAEGSGTTITTFKALSHVPAAGPGRLEQPPVLVLGLGNSILYDDGVGIQVARYIANLGHERHIHVLEAEVAGFALLDVLEGYDRAIIIDAVRLAGMLPGEIRVLDGVGERPSLHLVAGHQLDLPSALELGRRAGRDMPRYVTVVGVQIADDRTFSESLSPGVAAAVPSAARIALTLARSRG